MNKTLFLAKLHILIGLRCGALRLLRDVEKEPPDEFEPIRGLSEKDYARQMEWYNKSPIAKDVIENTPSNRRFYHRLAEWYVIRHDWPRNSNAPHEYPFTRNLYKAHSKSPIAARDFLLEVLSCDDSSDGRFHYRDTAAFYLCLYSSALGFIKEDYESILSRFNERFVQHDLDNMLAPHTIPFYLLALGLLGYFYSSAEGVTHLILSESDFVIGVPKILCLLCNDSHNFSPDMEPAFPLERRTPYFKLAQDLRQRNAEIQILNKYPSKVSKSVCHDGNGRGIALIPSTLDIALLCIQLSTGNVGGLSTVRSLSDFMSINIFNPTQSVLVNSVLIALESMAEDEDYISLNSNTKYEICQYIINTIKHIDRGDYRTEGMELRLANLLLKYFPVSNSGSGTAFLKVPRQRASTTKGVHKSKELMELEDKMRLYAQSDSPILLLGPIGSGKTTYAKFIHKSSKREKNPFIEFPYYSSPSTADVEIFGSIKGAFTDAVDRIGFIEKANKGTLFIDEVAKLPMEVQAKLLKVLEDKTFNRKGDTEVKSSDFRLICATNEDLDGLIAAGLFERSFFRRIKDTVFRLPALNGRHTDIRYLAYSMMTELFNVPETEINDEILDIFTRHEYEFNIDSLRKAVKDFVLWWRDAGKSIKECEAIAFREEKKRLQRTDDQSKLKRVREAWKGTKNKKVLAKQLEISYQALLKWIKDWRDAGIIDDYEFRVLQKRKQKKPL